MRHVAREYRGFTSRNACKPDRGIETAHRLLWKAEVDQVGTLVSPIEGLKLQAGLAIEVARFRRNACKPDRGIETGYKMLFRSEYPFRRNACKPDRGIETINVKVFCTSLVGRNACKPDRGIETSWCTTFNHLSRVVGTLVSPIEGLKRWTNVSLFLRVDLSERL